MTRRHIGALLSLGAVAMALGCSIDDRTLIVNGACVTPPTSGLVSDFSTARVQSCAAGICPPSLVGTPSVFVAAPAMEGLIYPYRSPGLRVMALSLSSTPLGTFSGQALRAVVDSGSPSMDASIAYDGMALQFLDCVDVSAYSAVTFTAGGNLGNCPLRFAAQFKAADAGTFSTPCSLDECFATSSVPVAVGRTTLPFSANGSGDSTALAGMQWELTLPSGPPASCTADFTIDDIRLVPAGAIMSR